MIGYVSLRLAQAVGVLWAAYTISFIVLYLLPSDPVSIMASAGLDNQQPDPQVLAELRREHGFDRSLPAQYAGQLVDVLRGDLGRSITNGRPVTDVLGDALPVTLQLAGAALLIAILAGGGLALGATYTRNRWLRQTLLGLPAVAIAVPTFWSGLVLLQLVSFRWGLVPATGGGGLSSLVLPAVTLAIPTAAIVGQVLARGMQSALGSAYAATARAKGLGRSRIHLRHALRNACIPALTVLGVVAGNLFAGSVIVETVFSRAGVGQLTVRAVSAQDIPVVQGVVLVGAVIFVGVNLLVDLVYPLIDPRITTRQVGRTA